MTINARLDEPRFQRCPEVCARLGVKKSTLYRWIAGGRFPAPVRIGDNTSAWDARAVDKWIAERIAKGVRAAQVRP